MVCSAWEAVIFRDRIGKSFLTVTPGIRMESDSIGDQKRVATPQFARNVGCELYCRWDVRLQGQKIQLKAYYKWIESMEGSPTMKHLIAEKLLEINAVAFKPNEPFTWTSGLRSPIYCDNRLTLSYPAVRREIAKGLQMLILENFPGSGNYRWNGNCRYSPCCLG